MTRKAIGKDAAATDRKRSAKEEPAWGGFVEINISEAEKKEFELWCVANGQTWYDQLDAIIMRGFKYGVSFVVDSDYYVSTLTGHGEQLIGLKDRYVLSARAETMSRSACLLVYKHTVLAAGDWGQYNTRGDKGNRFG